MEKLRKDFNHLNSSITKTRLLILRMLNSAADTLKKIIIDQQATIQNLKCILG